MDFDRKSIVTLCPLPNFALTSMLFISSLFDATQCVKQVRESIGVTLSILCSNICLHTSFNGNQSYGKLEGGSWDKFLTEQASERVIKIQNTSQSDNSQMQTDTSTDNGVPNSHSQDDVKWMETVLIVELSYHPSFACITVQLLTFSLLLICSYSISSSHH